MRRYRIFALALLAPAAMILAIGCGKKDGGADNKGGPDTKGAQAQNTGPGPGGAKTAIEAKEWTTLKGKVVYDGDVPKDDGALKKQMDDHKDKAVCCAEGADTGALAWRVNPENKGIANVVVWVRPPDGKFFKPGTPNEEVWKKKDATVDQPNCAFEPHVQAAFVSYFDGKENKLSGQKVKIVNGAPVAHNTKWSGDTLRNPGGDETLQSKQEKDITPKLKPDGKVPITMQCNIHQWMNGYLWPLDTPYYAVTDKNGEFEIKDLPAGTDVNVVMWYEGLPPPRFLPGGSQGNKVALKAEPANVLPEIKIKK